MWECTKERGSCCTDNVVRPPTDDEVVSTRSDSIEEGTVLKEADEPMCCVQFTKRPCLRHVQGCWDGWHWKCTKWAKCSTLTMGGWAPAPGN